MTVWLCLQLCTHTWPWFLTLNRGQVCQKKVSCSNTLKENAFLVGTLMTVTSFLPTKTFSLFSSHHVRLAFLLKRLFYVAYPKDQCLVSPESLY